MRRAEQKKKGGQTGRSAKSRSFYKRRPALQREGFYSFR